MTGLDHDYQPIDYALSSLPGVVGAAIYLISGVGSEDGGDSAAFVLGLTIGVPAIGWYLGNYLGHQRGGDGEFHPEYVTVTGAMLVFASLFMLVGAGWCVGKIVDPGITASLLESLSVLVVWSGVGIAGLHTRGRR